MSSSSEEAPEQVRKSSVWTKTWRIGLGSILLIVGVILALPLVPGPGLLVMIAGLAVMADEVPIAKRVLHKLKMRARAAQERLTRHHNDSSDGPIR